MWIAFSDELGPASANVAGARPSPFKADTPFRRSEHSASLRRGDASGDARPGAGYALSAG